MIGYVYVIRSYLTDDVYYGSTKQTLSQRMAEHRRNYKCWLNEKINYTSSFEIVKYNDCYIELVEECEYNNKQELLAREGFHIRNNKCVNKCIAGRTRQEYRQEYDSNHKEQIAEYKKEHAINNKEHIKEYKKQWYLKKKEQKTND